MSELQPLVDLIAADYGPVGIAVWLIYRKVDRLEARIDQHAATLTALDDDPDPDLPFSPAD